MFKDLETGEGTEFKHYQLCYIVIHCIPIYATYYTFKKKYYATNTDYYSKSLAS